MLMEDSRRLINFWYVLARLDHCEVVTFNNLGTKEGFWQHFH